MENRKSCPLRLTASAFNMSIRAECIRAGCGWWSDKRQQCAMLWADQARVKAAPEQPPGNKAAPHDPAKK